MPSSRDLQPVGGPVPHRRSFWSQENLVPIITLGLLASLLGATIVFFFQTASGDEPPIRVKNGSMEFHVLGNDKWKQKKKGTSEEYWAFDKDKERVHDLMQLTAVYDGAVYQGAPCKTTASGTAVHLVFNDETRVTVLATGKKTRISAATPGRLKLQVNGNNEDAKVLVYNGAEGFIKRVVVGDSSSTETTLCEFSNPTQLTHLLLLDYQD